MKPIHTSRLIAFCVLSILGGSSVAMDETSVGSSSPSLSSSGSNAAASESGLHSPRYSQLDGLLGGGKRAYTYRSEYKRLPVYQFGLGKRWAQSVEDKVRRAQPFSFGLGKRTRPYSFGLGKRSSYDDNEIGGEIATPLRLTAYGAYYQPQQQQQASDLYEAYAQRDALENYLQSKRGTGFNFGIGKREADEGGLMHEKVPVKHSRDKYLFGLGKRFYEDEEDDDVSGQLS